MGAAVEQRHDVMNVLGGNEPASGLAEFAKRVPGDVSISDFFPLSAVELSDIFAGLIVRFVFLRGVQRAVFSRRGVGAAGYRAGLFGSPSHGDHLRDILCFFVF
jgi:hypothetical protein